MLKTIIERLQKKFASKERTVLEIAYATHTGNVRVRNEDNYFVDGFFLEQVHENDDAIHYASLDGDSLHVLAVFDGMGGESAGDLASYTSVHSFFELYQTLNPLRLPDRQTVSEHLCTVSDSVYQAALEHKYRLIGSTISMMMFCGSEALIIDLGDSPMFLFRKHSLQKINVEHTNAEFLKAQGIRKKPALTQFLGVPPKDFIIEPYIEKISLQKEDLYLICSDGLTDMVSMEQITGILEAHPDHAGKICESLKAAALTAGGVDNITILVVKIT